MQSDTRRWRYENSTIWGQFLHRFWKIICRVLMSFVSQQALGGHLKIRSEISPRKTSNVSMELF